jgi:acetyl/propionyl-CoA carboxylase alpha subunit
MLKASHGGGGKGMRVAWCEHLGVKLILSNTVGVYYK